MGMSEGSDREMRNWQRRLPDSLNRAAAYIRALPELRRVFVVAGLILVAIFLPMVALAVVAALGVLFLATVPRIARSVNLFGRWRKARAPEDPV